MSAVSRPRRTSHSGTSAPSAADSALPATPLPAPAPAPAVRPREKRPFLLDFFPLDTPDQTRLSAFYDRLRTGRLSTTRCPKDGTLHWPPRVACPDCHTEQLDWVDLPEEGRIYAFSAVLGGAPLGMESEVPFAVGLVDLEGAPLRLFGRIEGRPWNELQIRQAVRVETYDVGDGRFFYRFRVRD
ncbi:MAG TPA: OB-fold domain-containing protein [Thermoplasmata archaeon]|nr:OB-fold domain-containing protein [Thermoplasmata archaeon]